MLGFAMKHFSAGTFYATWSGTGVCLLAIIGVLFFGDEVNLLKVVSFGLAIAVVIDLNPSGVSH